MTSNHRPDANPGSTGPPRLGKRGSCELRTPDFNILPAGLENVYTCAIYLDALATTSCTAQASSQSTVMCDASGQTNRFPARILGQLQGGQTRSSYWRDAAWAVFWVLNNCQSFCVDNKCSMRGFEAARGNGELLIHTIAPQ